MLPTLKSAMVNQKKVLVRVDFNVPLQNGNILDDTRLERALPTLTFLRHQQAKIILMTHIGRPKGQRSAETSTQQLCHPLSELLGCPVHFVQDCIGPETKRATEQLNSGDVLMLENLRYYPEEEADDAEFAQALAQLADIYVNEGFSVSHRAHASVHAITRFLPSYAGFLLEEEVTALRKALHKPQRPLLAIVGGAKVSTKLAILNNLIMHVDGLIVGGGIANTFLKAQGHEIGRSLYEPDMLTTAEHILKKAKHQHCEIILPIDVRVAEELRDNGPTEVIECSHIKPHHQIFDIGPRTIELIQEKIQKAKTVVWNGPFGVFEKPPFDTGTRAVMHTVIAQTQKKHLFSIAGGGETIAAIRMNGGEHGFSYLSTAGGAFLEWLEGRALPGINALEMNE
jgi:phosphoglycerate kinase